MVSGDRYVSYQRYSDLPYDTYLSPETIPYTTISAMLNTPVMSNMKNWHFIAEKNAFTLSRRIFFADFYRRFEIIPRSIYNAMSCRHLTHVTCIWCKKRRWIDCKWFQGIDMRRIGDKCISFWVDIYPLKPVCIRSNRPLRICLCCHTSKTDIWQRRKIDFTKKLRS